MKWMFQERRSVAGIVSLTIVICITHIFPTPRRDRVDTFIIISTTLFSLLLFWSLQPKDHQDATSLNKEPLVSSNDHDTTHSDKWTEDEDPIIDHSDISSPPLPPPILTLHQIKELHNRGLPPPTRLMTWIRIYSLAHHGDSFRHVMEKCGHYPHTLIVFKTKVGHILGGYAESPWDTTKDTKHRYFGGRRAFVFASHPHWSSEEQVMYQKQFWRKDKGDSLYIFPWSGTNDYIQICDWKKGAMGMGGGESVASNCTRGSFGWLVQDNFTVGSSGFCETFSNPPLNHEDGKFEIVDMDIYGFESMSMTFRKSHL